MIINSITIENFRCYYGVNKIDFNSNGKITLIYGDSGFGKSSFLQFFRWMFYGDPDFGSSNDKPLFNLNAYANIKMGQKVRVAGNIDFEHLGVKYSLSKAIDFEYSINPMMARVANSELSLQHLVNDSWQRFSGDIPNKINTILPKGLSKYFLLDGEKARELVLNSRELKAAIHQLFGLDAYANAINHIGNKNKKNSVLGFYQNELASKTTEFRTYNNMTLPELQETVQDLFDTIDTLKKIKREDVETERLGNARRDEIIKTLGQANNKDSIDQLIKANENTIKELEAKIAAYKHEIGNLFYQNYPYLFLSRLTSKSSAVLREKNELFAAAYKNVYESLTKDLLKEILNKNTCVCGRDLDEKSKEKIVNIMAVMPPDSYAYQFGQFVSRSKSRITNAQENIIKYEEILSKINSCEQKIIQLQDANQEKLEDLKRLESSKALVEELEELDKALKALRQKIADCDRKIAEKKQIYNLSSSQIEKMLKNSNVQSVYSTKIEFFEKILLALVQEHRQQEFKVKTVLNDCVREVFKKLTTQTELDVDKITFVNDDFTLRTTYLTGGQLAVDEYSYVIGIIKALQEMKMENNENPIIIDAPFAFTGNAQSEHIFKTLPTVSKQTILLTLDLNKIKNYILKHKDVYDFYVIKNETQELAVIERGNIDDIKFWYYFDASFMGKSG